MASFLKLVSKQSRGLRYRTITDVRSSAGRRLLYNYPRNYRLNHSSNPFHRKPLISFQSQRSHSTTQTQSDQSNASTTPFITTCTDTTRPAAPRGSERPNLALKYLQGQIVEGGFTVTKVTPIESYDCTAYEFEHNRTGAKYIHLDSADTNNAFAVALRTLPSDSSGVAHILEHTVLCGSGKFAVRDPFFHMLKRSLNTFMNAMTSADWTCYPLATQNEQDYHNLMAVYCDSVFFPNLNELDFMQEGHRMEFENMTDHENSDLVMKGVVYNEMKGNMSDPNDIFAYNLQKHLFPDNMYHHNFGGNPPDIPKLTHRELVDFHSKFYHPSNAVFYSYGDLGPSLQEMDDLILSRFDRLDTKDIDASIQQKQPLFVEPKSFEGLTPEDALVADPHQQCKICVSWICNDVANFEDTFGLTVLGQLLLSGPNAPFYNALIRPNIGYGYASATGYSMDAVQGSFSVGLNNIKEEDTEKVEKIILRTLNECVEKGFPSERVEAVLHQFEIDQKQRGGTFGLNLLFRMMSLITHRVYDSDKEKTPIQALQIDHLLQELRLKVLGSSDGKDGKEKVPPSDPKYFENLIRKYMVDNTHRVTLVMKPDKNYMTKLEQEEKKKLLDTQSALSPESKKLISEQSVKLKEYQDTNNLNVDVLPTLKVSDIPKASPDPTTIDSVQHEYTVHNELTDQTSQIEVPLLSTKEITNDLSYFKVLYDLEPLFPASSSGRIEDNDFHLIMPLYAQCLSQMGAGDMDYKQMAQKMELQTGGIGTEIHSLTPLMTTNGNGSGSGSDSGNALWSGDKLKYLLEINSCCLNRNVEHMMALLEDLLLHPNYDFYERLESLLKDKVQSDITQLIESGHSYAIWHAASCFGRHLPAMKVTEKLEGISQILFAGQLSNSLQGQRYATLKELIALFHDISYQLFTQQGPSKALYVSDRETFDTEQLMAPFGPLDHFNHPAVFQPLRDDANPQDLPRPVFGRKYSVLEPLFNSTNKFVDKKHKEQSEQDKKEGKPETHTQISMLRNYFAVPSQVNYVAAVLPTVAYDHEDCAALRVVAKLLTQNYLHHHIREQNGAYGGGATQNKHIFAFFSYRDPCSLTTTETFRQSVDWILKDESVSGRDIDEALLALFGTLDAPRSPSQKGSQEVLQGIDEKTRQRHREQLLSVNKDAVRNAVDQYLLKPFEENEVAFTIVGKQDVDQSEKDLLEENRYKFVTLG